MAYLSECFRSQVQVPALSKALDAYDKAAMLADAMLSAAPKASSDPGSIGRSESHGMGPVRMREMHFNRGIALRFDCQFDEALHAFRAAQLDRSLPVSAEVATTKKRVAQIATALKRGVRSRAALGDALQKGLDALKEGVRNAAKKLEAHHDPPVSKEAATLARYANAIGSRRLVSLADLRLGTNAGVAVAAKPLACDTFAE